MKDVTPNRDEETGKFAEGGSSTGRRKGARNRLHADFVVALQEHFAATGKTAIEIVYKESPKDYLKIIASVLPKEFVLEDGRLESMGDEELESYLEEIRRLKKTVTLELTAVGGARSEAVEPGEGGSRSRPRRPTAAR